MVKLLRPPVKYYGGKYYLSRWITGQFPSGHTRYTEPFGGAASVLLNKARCEVEVYNDLDYRIFNLLRTIRDDIGKFVAALSCVAYERDVFYKHLKIYDNPGEFAALDPFGQAVTTYIARRMSRGGACNAFCWSSRHYGPARVPGEAYAWLTMLDVLPELGARLQGVEMRNQPAWEVVEEFDHPDAVHYLDPPYVESSRTRLKVYAHEMKEEDHCRMAAAVLPAKGLVVISGYRSQLYDRLFSGWRVVEKQVFNHGSHDRLKERRTEVLWVNR